MIRLLFCSKSNILSNLKPPSLNNTSIIPKRNVSSKINKPNPEVFRPKSSKSKQENKDNHKVTPLGWFLILVPITTFSLGCWQVQRKKWKEDLIKQLEMQLKISPVPLPEDLADLNKMEYRAVSIKGQFLHDRELFLGPRSLLHHGDVTSQGGLMSSQTSSIGYLVITPFKIEGREEIILVNRGWVPKNVMDQEKRTKGQVTGTIKLSGIVRLPEVRPQFTPDHKQGTIFLYKDLPKMSSITGAESNFILDADYASTVQGGPIGGQTRVTLRNEHMAYIVTWFSLSAFTSLMWYRRIFRGINF